MRPKCFLYVGRFSCNDDSNSATGWIRSFKLMGMRGKIKRERGREGKREREGEIVLTFWLHINGAN